VTESALILELAASPWTLVQSVRESGRKLVAFLPLGAVEAHGPHLPLATDGIIAHELAARAGQLVSDERVLACLLPAIPYAPAEYARGFAGTLSIRPETLRSLLVDLARAVAEQGFTGLVLVNGHLEPDHVRNVRAGAAEARTFAKGLRFVLAPEWTAAPYKQHLPEEFFTGGAHAGGYETSLVLAAEPDLVDEEARAGLAAKPTDLAKAMKAGAKRFEEVEGGERAYFGDPARATAREGAALYDKLAGAVAEEVRAALRG
jgi:creatinine amidohydrolase